MPILPELSIRIRSVLLVLNVIGSAANVPSSNNAPVVPPLYINAALKTSLHLIPKPPKLFVLWDTLILP